MNTTLKQTISTLTKSEMSELITYVTNLLVASPNTTTVQLVCPHCGQTHIIKYGSQGGVQRFKCSSCGKLFSLKTNSLLYYSKIDLSTWIKFIDLESAGITLKKMSHFLQLSVTTCLRMRHKFYSACRSYLIKSTVMTGVTELDSSYSSINLKGTKKDKMPRKSKKRGSVANKRGLSHHKLCLLTSTDEADNCFIQISGLGAESIEKYMKFSTNFTNSNIIVSDSKPCIKQFANSLEVKNSSIRPSYHKEGLSYTPEYMKRHSTDDGYNIQELNEACKIIKDIVYTYHGVNTKYLNGYLAFKCLNKTLNYKVNSNELATTFYKLVSGYYNINEYRLTEVIYPIDLKEAYWDYNYGIFAH